MGGAFSSNRNKLHRSSSKNDITTNTPIKFLMKLLIKLSVDEGLETEGISRDIFTNHVFKEYPDLSHRIFNFLTNTDMLPPQQTLSPIDFHNQIQTILSSTQYEVVLHMYIKMYCGDKEVISTEEFQPIVTAAYNIFVDNHPDGPQICPYGINAIQSVVESIFHKQTELKIVNIIEATQENCPRMINIVHSYVVHKLSTAYRDIVEPGRKSLNIAWCNEKYAKKIITLAPSKIWILATILPNVYMFPYNEKQLESLLKRLDHTNNVDYLDYTFPIHWCLLYNRTEHGCSGNIFMHHVFDYKGPTLVFLFGKHDKEFCICVGDEWRESSSFWGDSNCLMIQLSPVYRIINKGSKIMYINFSDKGYRGIQVGDNPTEPTVTINDTFDRMYLNGKKIKLQNVEVWCCGPQNIRDLQMDIKHWNAQEAEAEIDKKSEESRNDCPSRDKLSNHPTTSI